MNVKIKRLTETATIPTKAHSTDACFDIYADCPNDTYETAKYGSYGIATTECGEGIAIEPGRAVAIHTGFATDIPEGYFLDESIQEFEVKEEQETNLNLKVDSINY